MSRLSRDRLTPTFVQAGHPGGVRYRDTILYFDMGSRYCNSIWIRDIAHNCDRLLRRARSPARMSGEFGSCDLSRPGKAGDCGSPSEPNSSPSVTAPAPAGTSACVMGSSTALQDSEVVSMDAGLTLRSDPPRQAKEAVSQRARCRSKTSKARGGRARTQRCDRPEDQGHRRSWRRYSLGVHRP
jgi:hypothetical protein